MYVLPQHQFTRRILRSMLGLVICLSLLLITSTTPAIAATTSSSLSQTNKAIALRYAQAGWGNKPNWEKVWDELVAPDLVLHFNSFPGSIVGLENNKRFSEGLFEGMPDAKSSIEDMVADGDLVVYRSTVTGTHTGNFLGYPATGKSTKLNDFTQVRIKNGKIVEMWYETNLLSGLQQLGLIPEFK
jgi:steroid delta-isomerase-like uncharacterized protein